MRWPAGRPDLSHPKIFDGKLRNSLPIILCCRNIHLKGGMVRELMRVRRWQQKPEKR
ncbi:hypothetical protein MED16_gp59 [Pantoea phage vB_PagS_MED16]|nr:hypothetical protein MED16_gp59 [Pantoea phage vB_PagS_MED16]